MRLPLHLLAAGLLLPVVLFGCSGAAPGPRQTIRVAEAADRRQHLIHSAKEHLRDTTDALIITPRVKGAIIADSQLNNRRNLINVGTRDYVVHLRGHVYSNALKARAGSVAARKLKKMHKNYRVSNELSITR